MGDVMGDEGIIDLSKDGLPFLKVEKQNEERDKREEKEEEKEKERRRE